MIQKKQLVIHTDGGSRGNPGPAAIGVIAQLNNDEYFKIAQYIGESTNNEAEYLALLTSIEELLKKSTSGPLLEIKQVEWKLDSMLVVQQINKKWKIKEPRLRRLAEQCWQELNKLSLPYSISYVPRTQNKIADALVNQALDSAGA